MFAIRGLLCCMVFGCNVCGRNKKNGRKGHHSISKPIELVAVSITASKRSIEQTALIPFILMYQFRQRYWIERKEQRGNSPLLASQDF
ncbi:hypothetical protein ABIA48_004563 [Pseudomonas sp. S30_BP2TU TE3576]|uniref:hypothetical protein n=1 Tax=Pseudomonas sp. S30_BP2TU TE3576 TaxID=3349329 RepID=UPI003D1EA28D